MTVRKADYLDMCKRCLHWKWRERSCPHCYMLAIEPEGDCCDGRPLGVGAALRDEPVPSPQTRTE